MLNKQEISSCLKYRKEVLVQTIKKVLGWNTEKVLVRNTGEKFVFEVWQTVLVWNIGKKFLFEIQGKSYCSKKAKKEIHVQKTRKKLLFKF